MPRKAWQTKARVAHYARPVNAHRPCAPDRPGTGREVKKVEVGFAPRWRLPDIREGDWQGLRRNRPTRLDGEEARSGHSWRKGHRAPVDRDRRDGDLRDGVTVWANDPCAGGNSP